MPDPSPWISALRSSHERFADLISPLGDQEVTQPSYDADWSLADVASHLGSQAIIFGLLLDAGLNGTPPPGIEEVKPIWDEWNALAPEDQNGRSVEENEALVSRIEALSREQREAFSVPLFGSTADLTGFLGARLSEHAVHTWDVAVALDPAATVSADAVNLLIDQMPQVARRGKPSAGGDGTAPIRIASTDPARSFTLTVSPEVSLSRSEATEAADLTMPAEALVRLVYGRLDPDHTPDDIDYPGRLDQLRTVFVGF